MSMRPEPIVPVPEDTARVAKAAFPKGNLYVQMRDVPGTIYDDEELAAGLREALASRNEDGPGCLER